MIIIFEISNPFQWKPGYVIYRVNDKISFRGWWLCFAVAWYQVDLKKFCDDLASGELEWR